MKKTSIILLLPLFLNLSCANRVKKAARDVKYSAYEMVGLEKRDLFKREVSNVKEEQEESGEAFKDALTKLKEVYNFDGGDLENNYESLNDSYKAAKASAEDVKARIVQVDTVAQDLFSEWEKEIEEISSSDLKKDSRKKLNDTKSKFSSLHKQLKKSEGKMDPVLTKLHDQVLYLKHNLNAKAVSGLKLEAGKIQKDIEILIKEMNVSIKQADTFIETL